jgi:hypothetical protein
MSGLSNDDFRKLMATPKPVAGSETPARGQSTGMTRDDVLALARSEVNKDSNRQKSFRQVQKKKSIQYG